MQMNRGNVKAFQSKVGTGNSVYLKAKDFEAARRFRPILWLYKDQPCDILTYQEGWCTVSNKEGGKIVVKDKPVRFDNDEVIGEDYKWTMSSYKGEKAKPQLPKPNICILGYDYITKEIKVIPFHQNPVVKYFASLLSPTNEDGSENEMFIPDLTAVDFIIQKVDDKTYTITNQNPKGGVNHSPEIQHALAAFTWSWDEFMAGNKVDETNGITYADVVDKVTSGQPATKTKAKAETKTEASKNTKPDAKAEPEQSDSNYVEGWREVKTAKGLLLGEQSLADLQGFKKFLEDKGKTSNNPLYNAICSGVTDLSKDDLEDAEDIAF